MKVQQCRRACSLGFTLIELLVVISIIALLLAILLPSLKAAHEAGQSSVCASNLKQIYQGAFLHAQDNDDSLPHYAYYGSAGIGSAAGGEFWPAQVAQALDNFEAGLFTCPADNNPKIQVPFYYAGSSVSNKQSSPTQRFTYLPVTYRGHCDLVWDAPLIGGLTPRKFSDWKEPTRAIMMLETRAHSTALNNECFRLIRDVADLRDPTFRHVHHDEFERHMGQSNILFIDGHIDSLLPQDIGELAFTAEVYGNGVW